MTRLNKPSSPEMRRGISEGLANKLDLELSGGLRAILPPKKRAVLIDVFALLRALGLGDVSNSQPRIRDGLIEVIDYLDVSEKDRYNEVIETLTGILSMASGSGLTASLDGVSIANRQSIVR